MSNLKKIKLKELKKIWQVLDPLLIITMIQNKQKFKNGIRKIALAVAIGPILFVLSSHNPVI